MPKGYEKSRFIFAYIIGTAIFGIIMFLAGMYLFEGNIVKTSLILAVYLVAVIVLFIIAIKRISLAYKEIENVSNLMVDVYEGNGEIPEEVYKQGEIGILYTNFYKVVSSLKESKLKEQEEKLFLRDIISDISHQLKTPLASLTVFMDLLYEDKIPDEKKQHEVIGEAKNQLTRMEWMVLSMLKLARIEAGAIQFKKKDTNVSAMLAQAGQSVKYLYDERHQNLQIDCPDDLILNCDGDWLTEAIINLLKNASDYSEEGKSVSVYTESTNVYTRICIKDEGMGIAESELPHIFKRFYRVNQQVNPNSVGIGLALVKSIVDGMGGKITVRSETANEENDDNSYSLFMITFVK